MNRSEPTRCVVITGMGIISPCGKTLGEFWGNVRAGRSAAAQITRFDPRDSPSQLAAEIHDWKPEHYMDAKAARRLERSHQYGIAAARLATEDAGLDLAKIDPDRVGVVEATSVSNVETAYRGRKAVDTRGYRTITPSMMIGGYVGSGSAEIANALGCKGHAITCSSSSASGSDVMGYSMSMIQHEDVDVMVAGGSEAPLIDALYFGFAMSRAMTRWAGAPGQAMKPFDVHGDGFVMGEAGAYLVLEELSHALGRGARIYAELLAHGRSCEAFHAMAPQPDGAGVVRALEKALRKAGIDRTTIDYVNPHGTANQVNDLAEVRALKKVFGAHARKLAVSSTKPITGHPLAAAGAQETIICALAIQRQEIPPTLNLKKPLPECDLDFVPEGMRAYPVRAAANLSSGFGGKTSALILGSYPR